MMRTTSAVAALLLVVAGYTVYGSRANAQTNNEILADCDIPRSYGRLVNVLAGQGAAGGPGAAPSQAIFEAEDGTIRWVLLVAQGITSNPQTASRTSIRPAFIYSYQCSLGGEWKRH